jgi:hypothetical protein
MNPGRTFCANYTSDNEYGGEWLRSLLSDLEDDSLARIKVIPHLSDTVFRSTRVRPKSRNLDF